MKRMYALKNPFKVGDVVVFKIDNTSTRRFNKEHGTGPFTISETSGPFYIKFKNINNWFTNAFTIELQKDSIPKTEPIDNWKNGLDLL